jgi:hypothetical protein
MFPLSLKIPVVLAFIACFLLNSQPVSLARSGSLRRADLPASEPDKSAEEDADHQKIRNRREKCKPHFRRQKEEVSDLNPPESRPLSAPGGSKPRKGPGTDHGDDPNDEQHHGGQEGYPGDDPYNNTTTNDKDHPFKPYPNLS